MEILVTLPLNEAGKARFAAAAPGHQLHFVEKDAVTPALLESAQAILGNLAEPGQLRRCKELHWLQLDSAGTDGYCAPGLLPEGRCSPTPPGPSEPASPSGFWPLCWRFGGICRNTPRTRKTAAGNGWAGAHPGGQHRSGAGLW